MFQTQICARRGLESVPRAQHLQVMATYLNKLKNTERLYALWLEAIARNFRLLRYHDPDNDGLNFWRERILFSVLTAGAGLSLVALLPALSLAVREGLLTLAFFDVFLLLVSLSLLILPRIRLAVRAAILLLTTFGVGVVVIVEAGFLSGGPAWLFCVAVLAGVLLGLRAALAAIFLNTAVIALLAWLASFGYGEGVTASVDSLRTVSAVANFMFLNAVAAVSVAVLVNGLQSLNRKTVAVTADLREEREALIMTKERLNEEIFVRLQSEKDLRQSERTYRLLAENIQDVIWTTDMQLRFTYISPTITRLLGWTTEEFKSQKLENLMTSESLGRALEEFERQYDLGRQSGSFQRSTILEMELLRKDGSGVWVEVSASFMLDEAGSPLGALGVARDITERIRTEREKAELRESLARSKKMEALGTLAGGVAHDLNNVLSGIVSYPDLLLMDLPPTSPLRQPIEVIQESGKKAAAIVQDLLTLARRGVPASEVVNLNELIAAYLLSPEHQRLRTFHPGVAVETRLAADLLPIKGSTIHLSKTVMNLVSNAAEAMPEGGTIRIITENRYLESSRIGDQPVAEGEYAILQVTDSGVGISREDLQRIFEPFFTKKKMGRSGTGLGMAVVWGTVQDHHGAIDVQSAEGRGTKVAVFLPATRECAPPGCPAEPLENYRGCGEKVLVVDDIKEQREIAAKILNQLGYTAAAAASGEEAVELLKHQNVDLLVLDMIMDPGIDGLETFRRVRQLNPRQKAIITSGYAETERVQTAQRLGAGTYLRKPYTVKSLALTLKAELNRC
jgi:two-component system cell cycle sensor histidine kinase/response regulator CckA